jgi:hypothetical protein
VSREAARAHYGVVLDAGGGVDAGATRRSREELNERRGALEFFDRGPGYARLAAT